MSELVKEAESLMRARDHLVASVATVAQRWVVYEALADTVPGLVAQIAARDAEIARLRAALGTSTAGWVRFVEFGPPHCRYCAAAFGGPTVEHKGDCPVAVYEGSVLAGGAGEGGGS